MDVYAEIAAAGNDPGKMAALLARVAPLVEATIRRRAADRRRKERNSAESGGLERKVAAGVVAKPAHISTRALDPVLQPALTQQQRLPVEPVLLLPLTADAVKGPQIALSDGGNPEAYEAYLAAQPRKARRKPARSGATEEIPKLPPIPAAWYDFLHRVWTREGGVVEVPRFRRAVGGALRAFTVGQIERAMRRWIRERNGRPINLEFFVGELGQAIKAYDEGGVLFVIPPADIGLTPQEAAAMQAEYLARLKLDDEAFMQALLTDDTPAHDSESDRPPPRLLGNTAG